LLPLLYGDQYGKQVLSYLIHLVDDIINFKLLLNEFFAFWNESYINIFKKLVKSSNKLLVQIINRIINELFELESRKTFKIQEKRYLGNRVLQSSNTYISNTYIYKKEKYIVITSINVNFLLKCVHPDNVIQFNDNKILKIYAILLNK